ncbi:MAG: zinc-ribbon and DUF3426 domain-containing protein [Gammaproteobacteria bacterium]|nr:zinc-ribbon and DUF3426 domain-containing protein [Gammaproteobacteria bacterium]
MFTQCPRCDAIFQLSASQLRAASGDVRCGQCLSVFNALNHLSEDLPARQKTEGLAHKTNVYDNNGPEKKQGNISSPDKPATGLSNTEIDDNDVFNDIITKVKQHDVPIEEIDRFEAFLATNTLPTEDASTTNDVFPTGHSPSADASLPTTPPTSDTRINTDFSETFSVDKVSATTTNETNFGDIDTVTAALDTDFNIDDDEFAEFAAYLDKPDDEVQHSTKINADDDKAMIEASDPNFATTSAPNTAHSAASEKTPQVETMRASEEHSSPANETQTANIPSFILDDLHAAKAEQLRPSNMPWMIGCLLLMLTLVLQVVYHSRDELAKDANLRPWLIQVCEVLNCTLSQPYDIAQIDIIGRDVRSHPSADEALIVSTTLINTATFVQPFPLLTMMFSDINGTKIAQRRFTPREYLSNTVDLDTGMMPNMPIRIDLELVDPGKAAVNYEFHAEADPRQTRPLT